jgi:Protein of unknown function (DUF3093)
VSRALARYIPSRRYASLTLFAVLGALLSAWMGQRWTPSWMAAGLFTASAIALALVALRPVLEIYETHLSIGRRKIPWGEIRRVDQTGWNAPLAVYLTLESGERILVLYPGDLDGCGSLLRHIRRFSRSALLDGTPYRQFWGEPLAAAAKNSRETIQKYPVLPPEEEEEIERMLQRLRTVGHLDSRSSDEK